MKFSLSLPRPPHEAGPHDIDALVALARAAERVGLHAVSASDHPFPVVATGRAGHQALDPFVLLSHLAAMTERLLMHFSLIVLPYRNPFVVARMLSTLDLTSNGRAMAAVGAGYLREEFDALGAEFATRGAQVRESVDAMRAAWSGEPVTMHGSGWRATGNVMRPKPLTTPHPVLWRGGNTATAIEHAARDFDGWAPFEVNDEGSRQTTTSAISMATLPRQILLLKEALEAHGRSTPIDICLVRTSRRWLQQPAMVIEHLQALESMGVTWLEFTVPGTSVSEWTDGMEAFAATAREAGVC